MEHPLEALIKIQGYNYSGKDLSYHRIGSEILNTINFGCKFDDNGICGRVRHDGLRSIQPRQPGYYQGYLSQGCCCSNCANNHEYLKYIKPNKLKYYMEK
jgi:hypothetical protein